MTSKRTHLSATLATSLIVGAACGRVGFEDVIPDSDHRGGSAWRRSLTITNNSPLDMVVAGYTVAVEIPLGNWVREGKALADGNDVRILRSIAASVREIDRRLTPAVVGDTATLEFGLDGEIPPSGTDDSYFIEYGDPEASAAPADPAKVYLLWADFEAADALTQWQPRAGDWSRDSGEVRSGAASLHCTGGGTSQTRMLTATGVSVENVALDFYLHASSSPGMDIAAYVRGSWNGSSQLTAYQFNAGWPGPSWHIAQLIADSWSALATTGAPIAGVWYRVQLYLYAQSMRAVVDGVQVLPSSGWLDLPGTVTGPGGVVVQCYDVPCNIDDVMARHYMTPEPSVALGAEEPAAGP